MGCRAWVVLRRPLTVGMVYANIHWPMDGCQNGGAIVAVIFVTRFNRFRFPVRPIDAILPHGNREYVMQIDQRILRSAQNRHSIVSIQIAARNKIFACITPIQFFCFKTYGKRIRPTKTVFNDNARCASIQTGLSDVRPFAPVRPVDVALVRIDGNGSRLL